ncbi:MAG: hypothetical protein FJ138_16620 [Deltaproteobacteria bacterium]|nr:hypothetical protein [Deltaproteobacteria bacterium]
MHALLALLSGLIFGFGLILSGMTQPGKVLGFLDVSLLATGGWQWDLAGVMGGALLTHALLRPLILRRPAPLLGGGFPSFAAAVDRRLLLGAALFGLGWGAAGFCPGPALIAAAAGAPQALLFVGAMVVGTLAQHALEARGAGPRA